MKVLQVILARLPALLLCITLMGVAAGAQAVSVVPWLYEVSVPVESQATAARRAASSDALLIMLARATGLSSVPRSEPVRAALADAERYYNEFSYANADDGLRLVVQFEPRAVLELLKSADLPIWRSARDRVIAWVVIEQDGQRNLLGAASPDELPAAMIDQSRARGLDLNLPLLDLEDQLNVDPAAVWGRLSQVLESASERYAADVLMVGRIRPLPDGEWLGEWQFWLDNEVLEQRSSDPDLLVQARAMVDLLTDELAARNAVLGREAGRLQLAVSGIRDPADYGELLGYLRGLEFIDAVAINRLEGNRLWIDLDTRADAEQLESLFAADRLLFADRLAGFDSADLQMVWRQQ